MRIEELARQFAGQGVDSRYAGFFVLFNRQQFYEAHDVLEHLWLPDRQGTNGNFYKGLIQLAGAFVHLQKDRLQPAMALFKLARKNLELYGPEHERLNVAETLVLISEWMGDLEAEDFTVNPMLRRDAPQINLNRPGGMA